MFRTLLSPCEQNGANREDNGHQQRWRIDLANTNPGHLDYWQTNSLVGESISPRPAEAVTASRCPRYTRDVRTTIVKFPNTLHRPGN